MITFSEIQLLRGGKALLDNATATIHPATRLALWARTAVVNPLCLR
ncbi:glutathione-regulated potassium-efflux system ATP-binding protein [Vibrio sp. JCM 19236]|nr:glutathione-regulated potassium-efflux system ATP-binding protein [Vibrio sp. JCM 19236]